MVHAGSKRKAWHMARGAYGFGLPQIFGRRRSKTATRPSIRVSLDMWRRQGAWLSERTGRQTLSSAINNNKLLQREFSAFCGFPHADLLAGPSSLPALVETLRQSDASDFVIKPVVGKNGWCVYLFSGFDGDTAHVWSLRGTGRISTSQFLANAVSDMAHFNRMEAFRISDLWIAESKIQYPDRELVLEFEIYTCFGALGPVFHRRGESLFNGRGESGRETEGWLDDALAILRDAQQDTVTTLDVVDFSMDDFDRVRSFASEVSRRIPLPFARIDVYYDGIRTLAGEITPWPGRYFAFREDLDRELGTLFEMSSCAREYEGCSLPAGSPWDALILGY
jgi:hypothetical protein